MISRWLFAFFNSDFIKIDSWYEFFLLSTYGLKFDLAAIIYMQGVFILMSFIPGRPIYKSWYKTTLKFFYFTGAFVGLGLNFIDFAYYRFNLMRMNSNVFEVIENEQNKAKLFYHFFDEYLYLFFLFFFFSILWFYLYRLVKIDIKTRKFSNYYWYKSTAVFLLIIFLCVGGVRGDYKKSTRPITLIHAMENVDNPQHADFILNTPFTIIRTWRKTSFKLTNKYSKQEIEQVIKPEKNYSNKNNDSIKPNVIIFILESMGREYWGSLNRERKIPNYKGYTPFLDSLSKHSLIFTNFFSNSRKSIHGMSAILAGIPSFETAYTSSAYSNQPIESIVSVVNSLGYDSSFFHGAPNGSMGFLGFSKTLGFNNYYGKDEYNNDDDFDGYWGIWDEPFLNYTKNIIDKKKEPFFATVFTLTSHEPYIIPQKYEDKFEGGFLPMHKTVRYTDFSIKKFFDRAKTQPWFDNTIFLFTADHGNQTYYDYYKKIINRFANPLMIYWPKGTLKGVSDQLSHHMDIYPTLVDLIGYDKSFRSWGQSLVSENQDEPYVINYFGGGSYFIMNEDYIAISNGEKIIGFYDSKDKDLENNLINNSNNKMKKLAYKFNLFLQNYMNRIVKGEMKLENSDE
tara:strand:- start:1527 stop:3398 length:1872 start_codon:yes stop_codon:yes gene_type:complete